MITASDKLDCAARELKMRKRVYPRWVEERRMSKEEAAHQIACMEAIIEDMRILAEKERLF